MRLGLNELSELSLWKKHFFNLYTFLDLSLCVVEIPLKVDDYLSADDLVT